MAIYMKYHIMYTKLINQNDNKKQIQSLNEAIYLNNIKIAFLLLYNRKDRDFSYENLDKTIFKTNELYIFDQNNNDITLSRNI